MPVGAATPAALRCLLPLQEQVSLRHSGRRRSRGCSRTPPGCCCCSGLKMHSSPEPRSPPPGRAGAQQAPSPPPKETETRWRRPQDIPRSPVTRTANFGRQRTGSTRQYDNRDPPPPTPSRLGPPGWEAAGWARALPLTCARQGLAPSRPLPHSSCCSRTPGSPRRRQLPRASSR